MTMTLALSSVFGLTLAFLRVGAMVFVLPFFGDAVVPVAVRSLCSLGLAWCVILGLGPRAEVALPASDGALLGAALRELAVGLTLGFSARLVFEGVVMAASLVSYQMGFGTANLLVPGSDVGMSPFAALHRMVCLLFFFSLSLHYIFLDALFVSFDHVPLGSGILTPWAGQHLLARSGEIFAVAAQMAAPMLAALSLSTLSLGIAAKAVPQLNVFTLSFPVSFFTGLFVYVAMEVFLPSWLRQFYRIEAEHLRALALSFGRN